MVFEEDEASGDDILGLEVDVVNTPRTSEPDEDSEDEAWHELMSRRDKQTCKLCPMCRLIITGTGNSAVLSTCCVCYEPSLMRVICYDGQEFVPCHCVCEDCYFLIRTPKELLEEQFVLH